MIQNSKNGAKTNLHALLIGINDYDEDIVVNGKGVFPPLSGAVPDVLEVQKRLKTDPDFNLRETVLLNEKATKKAIVSAFEVLGSAQKDDLIFIYFSGHGTVERADKTIWTSETNGLLEGIVCFYTSGEAGKLILADKELRWLLHRLWKKTGAEIVAIFDCCHSGDNTRAVADEAQGTAIFTERKSRGGFAFDQRAWADFVFASELKSADFLGKGTDDVLPQGRYIQFSAQTHTNVHAYSHTTQHTYILTHTQHTYIHTHTQHTYIHTHTHHTYIHIHNLHTYIHPTCIGTYTQYTYIHTYTHHTYRYTNTQHTYIHTHNIHTHIHTYIHTYIHIYIHRTVQDGGGAWSRTEADAEDDSAVDVEGMVAFVGVSEGDVGI